MRPRLRRRGYELFHGQRLIEALLDLGDDRPARGSGIELRRALLFGGGGCSRLSLSPELEELLQCERHLRLRRTGERAAPVFPIERKIGIGPCLGLLMVRFRRAKGRGARLELRRMGDRERDGALERQVLCLGSGRERERCTKEQ